MAPRKQPEPAKKQCKPRRQPEERLHERAWDHLTAKVYTKPEGEKPKPTVRKPVPNAQPTGYNWDSPSVSPKGSNPPPSDWGTRRMFVSPNDPAVAEWYRLWEEGSAEAAKGIKPKRPQPKKASPDVQFLYERKAGKHSAVESPSSEASYRKQISSARFTWLIANHIMIERGPELREARKRPCRRDETPEDSDDDLSAEVNRWNPFNGRKQPKSKGGY